MNLRFFIVLGLFSTLGLTTYAQKKPVKPFAKGKLVQVTAQTTPVEEPGKDQQVYCSLRTTPEKYEDMEGKTNWVDEKGMGVFEKEIKAIPAGIVLKILKSKAIKAGKTVTHTYLVTSAGAEITADDMPAQLACFPDKFWVNADGLTLAPKKFKKAKKIVFENH